MWFKLGPEEGFEWVVLRDPSNYDDLQGLDGTPVSATWQPIRVCLDKPDVHSAGRPADFPWCPAGLVVKRSAVGPLWDVLSTFELLPLVTGHGAELFVVNAPHVDALDETRSDIWRYPDSGRIMLVNTTALIRDHASGHDLFRLKHRGSGLYASERLVAAIERHRLTGLSFRPVVDN